jgi:hypothetical protein
MNPTKSTASPMVRTPQCRADIAELVGSTISGTLAALQLESRAALGSTLQWQCVGVVERLWQRREAVARALALPPAQWPPTASASATGLRWVVERASDDDAVRVELMRLGTQLLIPRLVELGRRQPANVPVAPAAVSIESLQPGEWFRIYLHEQWAAARLTWRSDNGRYFMFSSNLAGRSHSLSRSALEQMIARGQLERLARGPSTARSAAGAA